LLWNTKAKKGFVVNSQVGNTPIRWQTAGNCNYQKAEFGSLTLCFHNLIPMPFSQFAPFSSVGMRGGYFETTNIDPEVVAQMYKVLSINLSPNILGGAGLALMCNPPQPGDESYDVFQQEKAQLLQSLKNRARMMTEAFNSAEGISCQEVEGALYAFPQITLPQGAIDAAKAAGKAPDVFYCLKLLAETGISTVPGSGFGQRENTFHFRTTILPAEEEFEELLGSFLKFHNNFMATYGQQIHPRARL